MSESAWRDTAPWGITDAVRARLERVAHEIAREWDLRLGPQFSMARYSYAAPAGDDAVLKIAPVEDDQADHEAAALALWGGDGAVRLLRHDPERRAMLLERARPGTDASRIDEAEALAAAIDVGRRIWRPPSAGHPFRTMRDWVARWMPTDDAHPLVPVARRVYAAMAIGERAVVHGDFHHYNLLRNGDHWVTIDPKPVVGEPEFDIPPFLWNAMFDSTPTRERTERRIRAFADAGLDGDRIRGWTIVRGICDGSLPLRPGEPEPHQLVVVRELL